MLRPEQMQVTVDITWGNSSGAHPYKGGAGCEARAEDPARRRRDASVRKIWQRLDVVGPVRLE